MCVCVCPLVGTEMCRDGRRKRASSRGGSYQQGGTKFTDAICTHKLVQLYVEGRIVDSVNSLCGEDYVYIPVSSYRLT